MVSRILLIFAILIRIVPFISADTKNYTKCGQLFQCGNIKNIGYPFFGVSRPDYCGHPKFHLTNCQSDGSPNIEINSFSYSVLSIEEESRVLKLVRNDYLHTNCPQFLHNVTLDDDHFEYESGTSDLVLYYNCTGDVGTLPQPNQFFCLSNWNFNKAFYAMSGVGLAEGVTCESSVSVKIGSGDTNTASFNVTKSVADGFGVVWDANNSECDDCTGKGGRCGSDPSDNSFKCYDKGSSSGSQLKLAVSVAGAVLVLFAIGLGIFAVRKRRKLAKSIQSSQSDSKDNAFSSISKGLTFTTTPSVNFSQSVPSSYTSSKLDSSKSSSYFGVQVFTYTELEEATNNFDKARELGEGGFGTVYYGKLKDDRIVAVKRLYENNYKRIEQFMNELDILTRLRHNNLVTLYGCTSRRSRELLLVYEYIPNGTVADHLYAKGSNTASLDWLTRLKIAFETADALAYLHESDIIHRDVKTNNILLDKDYQVKVADFGLSRLFPTDVTHVSTAPQGTPGYVDPEYHNCYQLTGKSDVYSFGVVLIELISSKQAVDTNRNRLDINLANMAINRIQNGALGDLVDTSLGFDMDSSVKRMITLVAELAFRCLQTERDMRPSMGEVVKALKRIKDGKLIEQQEDVVEIVIEDDVALLRGKSTPVSPRSQ